MGNRAAKNGGEVTVYTQHRRSEKGTQASKQAPQAKHESLVAAETSFGARIVVGCRVFVRCLFFYADFLIVGGLYSMIWTFITGEGESLNKQ